MNEYDKQQWQATQAARDAALEAQRAGEAKARERSARNTQRKLERLRRTLKDSGDLTEWEDEFTGSVQKRIDEFGSAFHDLQKGRPGDALSFGQKRVVAALNKKVKDARKAAKAERLSDSGSPDQQESNSAYKPRSSFKSKTPKFTPRVRRIEDDFEDDIEVAAPAPNPISRAQPPTSFPPLRSVPLEPAPGSAEGAARPKSLPTPKVAPHGEAETRPMRPFLRLVKTGS